MKVIKGKLLSLAIILWLLITYGFFRDKSFAMKNKFLIKLVEAALILTITLILFEVALRVSGKYDTFSEKSRHVYIPFYQEHSSTWYLANPGLGPYTDTKTEFTFTYPRNSLGLFSREITPKQPNHRRILILGDSFTQGIGAPPDSCWPLQFETLLHTIPDSNYEVINAGFGGSDPFFAYRILADKLIDLQPDEVIFTINGTDILDFVSRGGMERFQPDSTCRFRKAPWYNDLYQYSHVVRCFVTEVMKYDYSFMTQTEFESLKQQAVLEIVDVTKRAKVLCDKHGTKFLVVVHPGIADYVARYLTPDRFRIFEIIPPLEKDHIECLDTRPGFAATITHENGYDYAWEIDGHFKSKGYALLARIVFEKKFAIR